MLSVRDQQHKDYFDKVMAPLVGGVIESVRGKRFVVRAIDGTIYNVASQGDSEGNQPCGVFGNVPSFKGSRYGSLAALKGLTISAAGGKVVGEEYGYPEVWPTFEFPVPAEAIAHLGDDPFTFEVGHDDEGNGAGWVHVWRKGTKAPSCAL